MALHAAVIVGWYWRAETCRVTAVARCIPRNRPGELEGTRLTNLHMTLLAKLGVPVESIGDSTGHLEVDLL